MNVVFYTCIFGPYDTPSHHNLPEGANFKTITSTSIKFDSFVGASRYYKMLPHRIFPENEISVYLDGNYTLVYPDRIIALCEEFAKNPQTSIFYKHPHRTTALQELNECIRRGGLIENPEAELERYNRFKSEGFNDDIPLTENNVIIRKHNDPGVVAFGELWWKEFTEGARRDQITCQYAQWKSGYENFTLLEDKEKFDIFAFRRHGE